MSYEEARRDRKRKRRNENLSVVLGVLQGLASSIGQTSMRRRQEEFAMAGEERAAARQRERDERLGKQQQERDTMLEEGRMAREKETGRRMAADDVRRGFLQRESDERQFRRQRELGEEADDRRFSREEKLAKQRRSDDAAADLRKGFLQREQDQRKFRQQEELTNIRGDYQVKVAREQQAGKGPGLTLTEAEAANVIEKFGGVEQAQAEADRLRAAGAENFSEHGEDEQADALQKHIDRFGASQRRRSGAPLPAGGGGGAQAKAAAPSGGETFTRLMGAFAGSGGAPTQPEAQPTGEFDANTSRPRGAASSPMKGTPGQQMQQELAWGKLAETARQFFSDRGPKGQAAYQVLQTIWGNTFPQLNQMPSSPMAPRRRHSGMGTTEIPSPEQPWQDPTGLLSAEAPMPSQMQRSNASPMGPGMGAESEFQQLQRILRETARKQHARR